LSTLRRCLTHPSPPAPLSPHPAPSPTNPPHLALSPHPAPLHFAGQHKPPSLHLSFLFLRPAPGLFPAFTKTKPSAGGGISGPGETPSQGNNCDFGGSIIKYRGRPPACPLLERTQVFLVLLKFSLPIAAGPENCHRSLLQKRKCRASPKAMGLWFGFFPVSSVEKSGPLAGGRRAKSGDPAIHAKVSAKARHKGKSAAEFGCRISDTRQYRKAKGPLLVRDTLWPAFPPKQVFFGSTARPEPESFSSPLRPPRQHRGRLAGQVAPRKKPSRSLTELFEFWFRNFFAKLRAQPFRRPFALISFRKQGPPPSEKKKTWRESVVPAGHVSPRS